MDYKNMIRVCIDQRDSFVFYQSESVPSMLSRKIAKAQLLTFCVFEQFGKSELLLARCYTIWNSRALLDISNQSFVTQRYSPYCDKSPL